MSLRITILIRMLNLASQQMTVELSDEQRIKILNADDLFQIMSKILNRENKIDRDKEHFWVVGLANNLKILFIELVSLGTVNSTIVEPMESIGRTQTIRW